MCRDVRFRYWRPCGDVRLKTTRVVGAVRSICLIGYFLASSACESYPPRRPFKVPSSAEWAGGIDGGEWVDCSSGTGLYNRCAIYSQNGDLIFRSDYTLEQHHRAATRSELRYRYVDGKTILLQGGLALMPVSDAENDIRRR